MGKHFTANHTIQGVDQWPRPVAKRIQEDTPLTREELDKMDLESMTPGQLEIITTRYLRTNQRERKECGELSHNDLDGMLFGDHFRGRRTGEVINDTGVPSIPTGLEDSASKRYNPGQQGMFWRSYAKGGLSINVNRPPKSHLPYFARQGRHQD